MKIVGKAKKLHWTYHVRDKMRFYHLSEARVKRILHSPTRIEEGIAPKTIALMQTAGNKPRYYELWVMIQEEPKRRKIISAWRYPGTTKPREAAVWNAIEREYGEFLEKQKTEDKEKKKKWSPL
jgi:hypothetical protein